MAASVLCHEMQSRNKTKIAPTSPDYSASPFPITHEVAPARVSAVRTCNHCGGQSMAPAAHGESPSGLFHQEPHRVDTTPPPTSCPPHTHTQVHAPATSEVLILTYKPQGVYCPPSRTTVFPGIKDKPVLMEINANDCCQILSPPSSTVLGISH